MATIGGGCEALWDTPCHSYQGPLCKVGGAIAAHKLVRMYTSTPVLQAPSLAAPKSHWDHDRSHATSSMGQATRAGSDPFANAHLLLGDHQHSLGTLLDAVDPSALTGTHCWPRTVLEAALSHPSDAHSLLRLFPSIEMYAQQHRSHPARVGKVLNRYLDALRRCRALAAVKETAEVWMHHMRAEQAEGAMTRRQFGDVQKMTGDLIRTLRRFAERVVPTHGLEGSTRAIGGSKAGKNLPASIKVDIERLVRFLYEIADGVDAQHGSSSKSAGYHLDVKTRRTVFSPIVLTPTLRTLLLDRLPAHSLTTGEWHACMLSAAKEGDGALVLEYHASKCDRQARATAWAQQGHLRRDVEMGGEDVVNLLPASDALQTRPISAAPNSPDTLSEWAPSPADYRHGTSTSPEESAVIDKIIRLRARGPDASAELMETIEPYLHRSTSFGANGSGQNGGASASPITPYAWSIFTTHIASNPRVSHSDMLDLIRDMPRQGISPHSMSPILDGLMRRGRAEDAWNLWEEVAELHLGLPDAGSQDHATAAEQDDEAPAILDEVLLATATYACAAHRSLDAAVELVDAWAARVKPDTGPETARHTIQLDSRNVNVLLHLCAQQRRPGLAFRLFAAAVPRWGVWPDTISLNLLLDCARFASSRDPDSFSARLKALAGGFRFRRTAKEMDGDGSYQVYDAAGFASGDTRVLLDPVDEHGYPDASVEEQDGLQWYERARLLMRDIIISNNPHFSSITSPLEFSSLLESLDDILVKGKVCDLDARPLRPRDRAPRASGRHMHIMPDAVSFQAYVTLLGFYNMPREIPVALAWAREMGIEPTWRCMCSALAFICETEGPRRRVRGWYEHSSTWRKRSEKEVESDDGYKGGEPRKAAKLVRDEEVLRRWLQEWVKGEVPTEAEVAAFINSVRSRGGRMSA